MRRALLSILLGAALARPAGAAPAQPPGPYLPAAGPRQQQVGGRYRLGGLLGKGTHATVWEGHHPGERPIAIRVLHREDAGASELDALEASRGLPFFPAHLGVHDVDHTRFVVAESLKRYKRLGVGETMEVRAHDLGRATRTVINLLRGLRGLHERGFVHADIYPHNLMFDESQGSAGLRIIDLGNARPIGDHPSQRPDVDVYRSAAVLVGLITGHSPHWGVHEPGTRAEVDREIAAVPDEAMRGVLRKALSPDAGERYASAQAFRDALRPFEGSVTRLR